MTTRAEEYGLNQDIVSSLRTILERKREVMEAIIFGSRAKGNYRLGSDIDLAVKGKKVNFETIIAIKNEAEKLGLLYKIDIVDLAEISDHEVKEHIHRVGKVFWKGSGVLEDTVK